MLNLPTDLRSYKVKPEIAFSWNGTQYTVKAEASGRQYIVLPNRQVIRPLRWLSGVPVQMHSAEEVAHPYEHAPIGEIAEHFDNSIMAQYAD